MENLNHADMPGPPTRTKKAVVGLLVVLVLSAMTGWLAFLGWGTIEFFRSLAVLIMHVWTEVV
ncbi:hypothetical protein [Bradyrhizobium sp.]|uniref:hypothetical protein n=1 Tax=Bradyrhizobium sp. TaxID=376 RepID=UPI0025C299A7|nr:hypothetical protein [Bradyrhizobium sp.]